MNQRIKMAFKVHLNLFMVTIHVHYNQKVYHEQRMISRPQSDNSHLGGSILKNQIEYKNLLGVARHLL